MARILGVVLLVGFACQLARADVLVIKKGRGVRILGLEKEIDGQEVTADNWRIYLPKSEGVIVEENYDSIVWKKNAKTKKVETFELEEVAEVGLAPMQRDGALDEGHQYFANRNLSGAIRAFQECAANEEARPVDRNEANFMIGFTYAAFGRVPSARKHFAAWSGGKSKYTPEAYRLLAEIHTGGQKYKNARATYQRIIDLPDIPAAWQIKAKAGLVKVDIAERKFKEAESKAAGIAKEAERANENDGRALAMGLQAQAIVASQDEPRYPEAEKIVRDAIDLKGVSNGNLAFLYAGLGDVLYAQKKGEDARFPYMRVVELYPEERGYVAHALYNAGNIFVQMAQAAQLAGNEKEYCDYMIKGMLLISECGRKYSGTGAARQASAVWRKNKAAYEACKKKQSQ
ncbi:MAG: tetratricopeptide repeat protein [Planctomycetota bacterium]|jgi:tetratricopeptide (TPR) repeat protein